VLSSRVCPYSDVSFAAHVDLGFIWFLHDSTHKSMFNLGVALWILCVCVCVCVCYNWNNLSGNLLGEIKGPLRHNFMFLVGKVVTQNISHEEDL